MAKKRKGSHWACKELAPSVKLLQTNINRIIEKNWQWKAEVK